MSDHLSEQQLDSYRRRSMRPAEIVTSFEHAATCVACRERLAGSDQLWNAFVALGPDMYEAGAPQSAHLSHERIAAYVDDEIEIGDREVAERHLDVCAQCQAELLDLREIKEAMSGSSRRTTPPAQSGPWPRLAALRVSSVRGMLVQGAVAAALLLIFSMATLSLRRQVAGLRAQLNDLQQRNDALQAQVSSISDLQAEVTDLRQSQARILDSSARTAVALYDGGRLVTLDRQGNLAGIESLPESAKQLVKSALSTQRLNSSASVSEFVGKPEALMGSSDGKSFFVLSPAGAVLQTDRPLFRWTPLSGVRFYVVTVYDAASNTVVTSPQLSETEWAIARPLKRGGVYTWEVAATIEDREVVAPKPPAPPAKFKVLEQSMLDELDRARHAYSDSHLVLGVLYAQAGLFEDAERELNALAKANPHSDVAQKLAGSVKAWRRLKENRVR